MQTDNPIIAELWRGDGIEALHRGVWVLVDTSGAVIDSRGDPDQLVYARSSSKSMQALPLLETGAADKLGLTDPEIAVSIASHGGEPMHIDAIHGILAKAGLTDEDLLCGTLALSGEDASSPDFRIADNCSGKHAGFLATTTFLGDDPAEYLNPKSNLQTQVYNAVREMTAVEAAKLSTAIDGCSAPTYRLPLRALATGLARMANPDELSPGRIAACKRIVGAARAHPELIGGTEPLRFDTAIMRATDARLFSKSGAEAIQSIGIVGAGLGFAAKIDDGESRSIPRIAIAVLSAYGHLSSAEQDALHDWHDPIRLNRGGLEVGRHVIPDNMIPIL